MLRSFKSSLRDRINFIDKHWDRGDSLNMFDETKNPNRLTPQHLVNSLRQFIFPGTFGRIPFLRRFTNKSIENLASRLQVIQAPASNETFMVGKKKSI